MLPERIITAKAVFIDPRIAGEELYADLAWIDKFCPAKLEIPGVGTIKIPDEISKAGRTSTFTITQARFPIIL